MTSAIRDGFSSLGFEPVAQTFLGLRAFRIHESGLTPTGPAEAKVFRTDDEAPRGGLRGVFKFHYQWGAGTNDAVCLRPGITARGRTTDRVQGKQHDLLMPECDCGFWAYTADSHVLSIAGPAVLGVVEGWGRCVLGPHGFRAEHARVVGLAFPTGHELDQSMIDAAAARVADTVKAAAHVVGTLFGQTAVNVAAALAGRTPTAIPVPPAPARTVRPWERVDASLRADVETCYPGVPVVESVARLREMFPLSDLSGLIPDEEA